MIHLVAGSFAMLAGCRRLDKDREFILTGQIGNSGQTGQTLWLTNVEVSGQPRLSLVDNDYFGRELVLSAASSPSTITGLSS